MINENEGSGAISRIFLYAIFVSIYSMVTTDASGS